ncbi:MAG: DUF3482 domain-containing protein [Acidobacteriota bacterium]
MGEEAEALGPPSHVTLALVSHTNVGKTTLARTLLRRDVGEVLDQAHVTDEAELFDLLEIEAGTLRLADTPGFGDSARLLKRLRVSDKPVYWFLQQNWDRLVDRPFWCSQQAALAVREYADVVLYLVNATEHPEDAGYADLELELMEWLQVPTLILLNQTGDTSYRKEVAEHMAEAWRRHTERFSVVKEVVELDAFTRCWVEEGALLARAAVELPAGKKDLMAELCLAWQERNLETFRRAVGLLARYLAVTATDRESLPQKRPTREQKTQAMEALGHRLIRRTEELMASLLTLHELEGDVASQIDRQLDAFAVRGEEALGTERSALLGSVVSGAVGGLAADLLAGGLTFGGGMLAGAILGAVGGAGLARGYELVQGDRLPEVGWAPLFLIQLVEQALLRYLAVAHFGRGRGEFRHEEASRRWQEAVSEALRQDREDWRGALQEAAAEKNLDDALGRLQPRLGGALRAVLIRGYPGAAELLSASRER